MTPSLRSLSVSALVVGLSSLSAIATPAHAQTAVSASVQIGDFHLAVSNYYHVTERDVVVVHERRMRDDDLPVVFFIAQRAHVAPSTIVDLRLHGMSWWDISVHYRLGSDVYYVPVSRTPGPPYGKAYGYYKKPRSQWNRIVLADDDIVNLVNLRFLSEYYHVKPEQVIEARAHGRDFVAVQSEVSGHGNGKKAASTSQSTSSSRGAGSNGSAAAGSNGKDKSASTGRGRGRGGV